jgi:hypothetical protein
MIEALVARFVATRFGAALSKIPRWAWIALAIVLAIAALCVWHGHRIARHDRALEARVTAKVDAAWQARFDQMRAKADDVRQKAETLSRKISATLKDRNDAHIRNNAADADDLRLHGPGRASAPGCRPGDHPGLPAAAGQSGGADRGAGPPSSSLLADDRLAFVPWSWLVDEARQADDSSAEVLTWRNWYEQQAAAWEKMRNDAKQAH